ncbi:MAG: hypothetical protein AB8Z16_01070 [Coxiella endosymbiont of Haemaphysalis qinghaiensis]
MVNYSCNQALALTYMDSPATSQPFLLVTKIGNQSTVGRHKTRYPPEEPNYLPGGL